MKIGIFTNNYLPIISGVTESVESFRRQLERKGHQVYIFAPHFPDYKDENPNVFRYASLNVKYKTVFPIAIIWDPRIYQKAKELKLDIIHTQHPFNTGKSALRIAKKLKLPIVFTNHTRYEMYAHFIPVLPQKFLKWYVIYESARFANRCSQIIAPSQSIKNLLIGYGVKTDIEVLPTGIDIKKFKNAAGRFEVRKNFGIEKDEILLITVSRITKEKNIEFLLRVFSRLYKNKNLKYMIAGSGEDLERLKQIAKDLKISDRVIFAGTISHSQVPDYFKAGDVFMHSSLSETQGLIIIEAMAAGLPAAAIRATGVQDIIESGIDGFLSENDEREFADKVGILINDADLRLRISEKAVKKADEYSEERCGERMIKVYERILRNN